MPSANFQLGQVVATPAALETLARCELSPAALLAKHAAGDWGDVPAVDAMRNEAALQNGARLLSSYDVSGKTIWIITEAEDDSGHRAATTLLLPEEY